MSQNRGFELIIEVDIPIVDYSTGIATGEVHTARLHLDTINERTVSTTNHLASQPIYNGQTLIDHMYVNPDSYTVSGTFSMYGKYNNDPYYHYVPGTSQNGDRLTNIQKTFEYIKSKGLLCKLSTYIDNASGSPRFKVRKNMAIESITWNEYESSMKYSITFKEVKEILFNDVTTIKVDEAMKDLLVPIAVTLGDIMFANIVVDNSTTMSLWDRIIIGCLCQSKNYIDLETIILSRKFITVSDQRYRDLYNEIHNYSPDILNDLVKRANKQLEKYALQNISMGALGGAGVGLCAGLYIVANSAASTAALSAAGTAAAASSSAGPVGLIIGVAILVGAAIGMSIADAVNTDQIEKKKFKLIDNIVKRLNAIVGYGFKSSWGHESTYDHMYTADEKRRILIAENSPYITPNANELNRLSNFLKECNTTLNTLSANAKFYTISTNYNTNEDVECSLTINGKPYKITFTNEIDYSKYIYETTNNQLNSSFSEAVKDDINLKANKKYANIVKVAVKTYNAAGEWELLDGLNGVLGNVNESSLCCNKLEDMDDSQYIFKDASQLYYCYLYNPWFEPEVWQLLSGVNDLAVSNLGFENFKKEYSNRLLKYYIEHSGIAYYYLVQSYGTVKAIRDKLLNKIQNITTDLGV